MKKNFFTAAWILASASAVFSSCSSNDDLFYAGNDEAPVQMITMTVANAGDNFNRSRTADDRNLYSSEAKQSIENVKVVIYKLCDDPTLPLDSDEVKAAIYGDNKTIVAQKLFTDWMNGGVSSVYSGSGRQASWTLSTTDIIEDEGIFMAYAVGYNTDNYDALTAFGALKKNETATFPLTVATKNNTVKEIFAGSTVFAITNEKKGDADAWTFNASLTLHRQVAGTIGYFTNIPTKGNKDFENEKGVKLRLVAAAKNTNAVFAEFNSQFIKDESDAKFVVNGFNESAPAPDAKFYGSSSNDAYTVYEIALSEWFTDVDMDSNKDGYLNASDNWKNKIYPANDGTGAMSLLPGTVLASSFLMPFQYVSDKATLQLQMLNDKDQPIRYWNIRLPNSSTSDSQFGTNVTLVSKNGSAALADITENAVNYSIVRNHLYNIGIRDNGDNPGEPGTPDDKEKPQDLNNETLILKVNDNWEMVHQLEVD